MFHFGEFWSRYFSVPELLLCWEQNYCNIVTPCKIVKVRLPLGELWRQFFCFSDFPLKICRKIYECFVMSEWGIWGELSPQAHIGGNFSPNLRHFASISAYVALAVVVDTSLFFQFQKSCNDFFFDFISSVLSVCSRDGTGRDFRDPTRPVACLFDRPVTGRSTGEVYLSLTGR